MKCEVCGITPSQGATLHRQNEKGIVGVWRCEKCNTLPIDPEIKEILDALKPLEKEIRRDKGKV